MVLTYTGVPPDPHLTRGHLYTGVPMGAPCPLLWVLVTGAHIWKVHIAWVPMVPPDPHLYRGVSIQGCPWRSPDPHLYRGALYRGAGVQGCRGTLVKLYVSDAATVHAYRITLNASHYSDDAARQQAVLPPGYIAPWHPATQHTMTPRIPESRITPCVQCTMRERNASRMQNEFIYNSMNDTSQMRSLCSAA